MALTDELKFPGDQIGYIEEYVSGDNTYDDGNVIRSTVVGSSKLDNSDKTANIIRQTKISVPDIGDIVIGTVAAVLGSMIVLSMDFINQRRVYNNVECICQTRHLRKKNVALIKDTVRAKIIGMKNGTIHATIDDNELGVLFTKCRKCFGIVGMMRDAVKCKECGWIDDRKLSSDFGKIETIQSDKQ